VKNKITALKKAGRVETTGEIRSQMEQVRLVAPRHRPIKWSAVSATHDKSTVAGLFADPPDWLVTQLKVYRKNPARHKNPLCAAVAAIVLGDGARAGGRGRGREGAGGEHAELGEEFLGINPERDGELPGPSWAI
jgi:hypothetical protein